MIPARACSTASSVSSSTMPGSSGPGGTDSFACQWTRIGKGTSTVDTSLDLNDRRSFVNKPIRAAPLELQGNSAEPYLRTAAVIPQYQLVRARENNERNLPHGAT